MRKQKHLTQESHRWNCLPSLRYPWVSPDQWTENQIDDICVAKRFRRSVQVVRVDVAEQTERLKYNVSVLKDRKTKEEFNLFLINKF